MSIFLTSTQESYGLLCSQDSYASCFRFFEPRGVHVEQLGEKTLEQLVSKAYLNTPHDVFSLTAGKLCGLPQCGPKQAQILVNGIHQARNTTLTRLLFAFGIYGIEEHSAYSLAGKFNNLRAIQSADMHSLKKLLPESSAVNLYNFFRHQANISAIEKLMSEITIVSPM
ncbi:TPA: hypothetical protein N3282_000106 [Klebsiella aerogenes]|nr:hypothetical protein [Klebsiella aerogenes]HED2522053.1 hypothetical protein [Klebsiella aerogenes]